MASVSAVTLVSPLQTKGGIPLPRIAARATYRMLAVKDREQISKHLQPRTASTFQCSGILEAGPPDCWIGWLMGKNGEKSFKM
jgi:hypothetical protein